MIKDLTNGKTELEKAIQWRKECADFEPERQAELDFAIEVLRKAEAQARKTDEQKESSPPAPEAPTISAAS